MKPALRRFPLHANLDKPRPSDWQDSVPSMSTGPQDLPALRHLTARAPCSLGQSVPLQFQGLVRIRWDADSSGPEPCAVLQSGARDLGTQVCRF